MISFKNFNSTTKFCDDWISRSFRLGSATPTLNSNSENILLYLVSKANLSLVGYFTYNSM